MSVALASLLAAAEPAQAIEQIGRPLPPAVAVGTEQTEDARPADRVVIPQLPPRPLAVPQPRPRRKATPADTADTADADLARATATVIDRGQAPTPELVIREVGPDTLARLVTNVGLPNDPALPPKQLPQPARPR